MTDKDNILSMLKRRLRATEFRTKAAMTFRRSCRWYELGEKRRWQREYEHYRDQSGLLNIIINEIKVSG